MKKVLSGGLVLLLGLGTLTLGLSYSSLAPRAEEDYYASVTAKEGQELLGQVHDLITVTHTYYSSYDDCRKSSVVTRTDPGPNGSLTEFYTQAELSSVWQSGAQGTWNREHVWCKSCSEGLWKNVDNSTRSGGSDLLHIRPTETSLNSTRGNLRYGEVTGGSTAWQKDPSGNRVAEGGTYSRSAFEPLDAVKGDVARIVLYVYTHYNTYSNVHGSTNGSGASSCFGTLKFTDIIAKSSEESAVELLLSWNELDPVDELERTRNEAAFDIQGNRNPFVDHPEYAQAIWAAKGADKGSDARLIAFREAVAAISAEGALADEAVSLLRAQQAYLALTPEERESAAAEVAAYLSALEGYNTRVGEYNREAERAQREALAAMNGLKKRGEVPE